MRKDLVKLASEIEAIMAVEKNRKDPDPSILDDLSDALYNLEQCGEHDVAIEVRGGCVQETYGKAQVAVVDWDNLTGGR